MNADLLKKANDTSREIAIIEKVLADGQNEFIIGAPTERIGDFDQANISDDPVTYEAVKSALTEKLINSNLILKRCRKLNYENQRD